MSTQANAASQMNLQTIAEIDLGQKLGQCRATPVELGSDFPRAVLVVYCADFDVDPYVEMFYYPTDTLKMALVSISGEILWKRDLGPAVVPGMWFTPFHAFDLDGDGMDEIYFVGNDNMQHPLSLKDRKLVQLDAHTGETVNQWPWPNYGGQQNLSHTFRNFIRSGYVHGEPVLITAQGTYGPMFIQGYNPGMTLRFDHRIAGDSSGARGSHMAPVVDINNDGVDELLWGERCIELDQGKEMFCAARDSYRGHSDVIWPVWDEDRKRWFIYTCRESDPKATPRVMLFDDQGQSIWGDVDHGHMDMGWTARIGEGGDYLSMAIRIGKKTCGPDGRFHQDRDEFVWHTLTGKPVELPFSVYQTVPVDINGDGIDELVRGIPGGNGEIINSKGQVLGSVGGPVALRGTFTNHLGQQLLTYHESGQLRIWADLNAQDKMREIVTNNWH